MSTKEKMLLGKVVVFALAGAMLIGQAVGVVKAERVTASAEEIVYCDDIVYGNDDAYQGQGSQVSVSYNIYCDEMVTVASSLHQDAPSFSFLPDSTMRNYCGAMAGRNVVVFYDRWYTNLISDYTPGMVSDSGRYYYYVDSGLASTNAVMTSLYNLMQIEQVGGTTSQNFKDGLSAYNSSKGYATSYSSFYGNATTVNLMQLAMAINQNKVGVVMCTQYNFVYNIIQYENEGRVRVSKVQAAAAHIMMVYGYKTIAFYQNGNQVCTKTFLYACSGFGGGEMGYIELNDYLTINEAVIVTVA